jgi:hypothetical protein
LNSSAKKPVGKLECTNLSPRTDWVLFFFFFDRKLTEFGI